MNIKTGPHNLTADLAPGHITHIYSNRTTLQAAAHAVLNSLTRNECDGNQWILILGIPKSTISSLDNDKSFLDGIHYRFQWEGTTGLIKLIPSAAHEQINADFTALVADKLAGMGIHRRDRRWGLATTYYHYQSSVGIGSKDKGKQGDQIFLPTTRQPAGGQVVDWPTLVLEIGVWMSKAKLEEDVKWWFNHSEGRVRIVLVALVRRQNVVVFEKWQLLPSDVPGDVSRGYIASLGQQSPPLVVQAAASQRCYCVQEVTVDRNGVAGAPMVLPFRALFDRDPDPSESKTDVAITAQDFREITATVF